MKDLSYLLQVILSVAIITIIPMLGIFIYTYMRRFRMSLEKEKIELEMFRKSYENSIYQITNKLTSNNERWNDVNHLLIEAAKRNISDALPTEENAFLNSMAIDRKKIKQQRDVAFLLAPINEIYQNHISIIKSSCADVGLICKTADEKFINGPILNLVIRNILSARIIIALIDGRNPNVYYELGLAHAFGKTVVMISNTKEEVSFDIRNQRIAMVDWSTPFAKEIIQKALIETIVFENIRNNHS